MSNKTPLTIIRAIHTFIWGFFNVVIFYMLYAVITNRIDKWLWIGFALVALEGITLLVFKWVCPLTIAARKYSSSTADNFDIFLPNWLARHTKLIYTSKVFFIAILTLIRLLSI